MGRSFFLRPKTKASNAKETEVTYFLRRWHFRLTSHGFIWWLKDNDNETERPQNKTIYCQGDGSDLLFCGGGGGEVSSDWVSGPPVESGGSVLLSDWSPFVPPVGVDSVVPVKNSAIVHRLH